MKFDLPENHSLSDAIIDNLVFKEGKGPALSDVQFAALDAGIGRGESVLVVSPTSTGKTQIAVWAIAKSIECQGSSVYLVNYRALAKQKFDDFKTQFLPSFLNNNSASLVIATGDYVEDADGNIPSEPLRAPLLVATYEKYLALLSASGIPTDMSSTTFVCDEIQLIGDHGRGQNVEVLLTLLRNAGWKQFVGLSAVLRSRDASDLAGWLDVTLVSQLTREKHLQYECWTPNGIAVTNSADPEAVQEGLSIPKGIELDAVSILAALMKEKKPPVPVIVFCMTKPDTYKLAERFLEEHKKAIKGQLSLAFDGLPTTTANAFLAETIGYRVAIHNADLMDEERHIVEQYLLQGKLDVVFATSTLAAGVNYPLGAAIFARWDRWDFDRKVYVPIDSSEFHNMAGRVGRMGFDHELGRVIFIAGSTNAVQKARKYLKLGELPYLESRVTTERFNQLALQLVTSGLCSSKAEVEQLVCTSLSALREQDQNPSKFKQWPKKLSQAIDELVEESLLIQTASGQLSATVVGKAIGHSGLLPETGVFLLNYVVDKVERLVNYLPKEGTSGDITRLAFVLFSACLSSPEFTAHNGKPQTRFLPYPLKDAYLFNADVYRDDLIEPVWQADVIPINGAKLCLDWMDGAEIHHLEGLLQNLSAGMLREMYRNLVWILQGLASIITAASDTRVPHAVRPNVLRKSDTKLIQMSKLPRVIRRLSFRLAEGLPDDVLWMMGLNSRNSKFRLTRNEILALKSHGITRPEQVIIGSKEADNLRLKTFEKAKPSPHAKANWLRDVCRDWKLNQRKQAAERHLKRARRCQMVDLVKAFYDSVGTDFEKAFEAVLSFLKISFKRLDDKTKTGAPDYLIQLVDSPPLIVELKSKEGTKLVDYNKAVEVLAASEVHGHKDTFCVTLCHPGVDPSVPMVVVACGRLSVVESNDIMEALLRVCEGALSHKQIWQWLASPGQALAADLPYREYS